MELEDLVQPEGVVAHLKVTSKKQALQELSERAAKITGLSERAIFETLLERERLGSTGVGQGIAIPHGKLPEIDRLYGLFARLELARPRQRQRLSRGGVPMLSIVMLPQARLQVVGMTDVERPIPTVKQVDDERLHRAARR